MDRAPAMAAPGGEDLVAPDSWEMADLEESVSRLLLSSGKSTDAAPAADFDDDDAPQPPDTLVARAGERGGVISEELLGQVDQFLREALEKPRERLSILRMEQDVEKFIRDPSQQQLEFQGLPTSYLRLAAHRVAQHYYLQSMAVPDNSLPDGSGSRIVLCKTNECRFPSVRLADIPVNLPQEDNSYAVKVAIKQRPQRRLHGSGSMNSHSSKMNEPKTVEERKEEYNKARARIFSSTSGGGIPGKLEGEAKVEPILTDGFPHLVSARLEEKPIFEGSDIHRMSLGDSSVGSNRRNRSRMEKEPVVSRYRPSNRVAIFRDREVDRKDPDYDRSYDRYMQRFDPGFGFNGGPYAMQALYSPAINYNTEFPQLGSGHRPQISVDHQPRPIPQHLRGPWPATSSPTTIGYGPPEGMMVQFNPNHVGSHGTPSIYMTQQYPVAPRSGMPFVHPHEHVQPFSQTHQQQPESSFGLARPR